MKLEELGKVYLDSVIPLDELHKKKKAALKKARKSNNYSKEFILKNEIRIINEMRCDCLETGHRLKNYYSTEVSKCPKQ